jgi:hypothetical protein
VKFKSAEEYLQVKESSSYSSYKKVLPNLYFIKEQGIGKFMEQPNKRMQLLKTMISKFDDGRSKSFFCKAAIFHDLTILENSIEQATGKIISDNISQTDMKSKANILKNIIGKLS